MTHDKNPQQNMHSCVRLSLLATLLVSIRTSVAFAPHPQSKALSLSSLQMSTSSTKTDYDVVKVDLSDGRDYPIYIGAGFSDEEASEILKSHVKGNKALIITNDRISPMYLEKYESLLKMGGDIQVDSIILPDGEENKSMDVLGTILDKALETRLDRQATFIALGGGVIGDMAGFAAAIYQRGINFVQVRMNEWMYKHMQWIELCIVFSLVWMAHDTTWGNCPFASFRFQLQSWQWSIRLLVARLE